ncbi:MAG: hypothetical protein NZ551_05565 [Microscillaceae bacterium]|nr:hypothetical protein [Microscillaceae bacterium]MDW8460664.1 hypothetical protein [Cytophagales bacterium]
MKYIEKSTEPMSLTSIKGLSNKNVKITFDSLPENVLKNIVLALLQDQGFLCCYCQDSIDAATAYLTHFYPREFFKDEELNYSNMFLTCSHARSLPPKQQHCD